jgi:competence protein ComEC
LSFLAVASLMLQSVGRLKRQASRPLTVAQSSMPSTIANSSFKTSIGQLVLSACLSQWACTIGLLVPLLYFFGASSAVSPLANAVAIPLISMVVTPLALIAAFFAVVWQSVFSAWPELNPALKILALNDFLLAYLLQYLEAVAGLRGLWFVSGELPFALAALLTCGLLGSLALRSIKRQACLVAFSLSGLMLYIVIAQTLRQKQEHWELTFMDVGQGSSILLQHKNRAMLIDTGPRRSLNQDSVRSIVLPTLAAQQVRALDWLVVTHQDMAHSGGLRSLLHGIPVKTVVASLPKHSYEQHLLDSKASNKDQKVDTCKAGNFYEFGDLRVQVLSPFSEPSSPQHPDDMSCVLLIEGYGSRVLLPADIRRQSQQRLIRQYGEQLRANVLAMPGQGSKTAFNHEFVAAVAPSYAVAQVASVSKGNRWRHPDAVLPAYTEVGATVFRTDHHGAIKFRFSTNEQPLVTWARATRARYWHFSGNFVKEGDSAD